jgi:hypothetical protein
LADSKVLDGYASPGNEGAFDKEALDIAKQHLGNYCDKDKGTPGAESPYLFDHLIDIGFRKLDAYAEDTLRYGLTADEK